MKKRIRTGLFIFVFWIVIWFLLDNILSKKGILFASPIDTLNVFIDQGQTGDFCRKFESKKYHLSLINSQRSEGSVPSLCR